MTHLSAAAAADPAGARHWAAYFGGSSCPGGSRPWLRAAYAAALAAPNVDLRWWRTVLEAGGRAEYGPVPVLHDYDVCCTTRVVLAGDLHRMAALNEPVLRALAADVTDALDAWAVEAVEELLADAPALLPSDDDYARLLGE